MTFVPRSKYATSVCHINCIELVCIEMCCLFVIDFSLKIIRCKNIYKLRVSTVKLCIYCPFGRRSF